MTNLEIEAFLTVCQQKTISKAAAELYVSQSSLSTRLRRLERELGYLLFLRQKGGREVELTADGRKFYELALEYQELVHKMFTVADHAMPEKLRVSSINSVGTYLLPAVYECFMQAYPEVRLDIQDMEAEMACTKIARGETDLAFTTENRKSNQIDAFPVLLEPMVLICSEDSSYPDLVKKKILEVKNEVYIEWSEEYSQWHRSAFGANSVPQIRLEIMDQLQRFMKKKDIWAFAPISVAEGLAETSGIRLHQMTFDVPGRIVYALCARGMRESEGIAQFLKFIPEELSKLYRKEGLQFYQ